MRSHTLAIISYCWGILGQLKRRIVVKLAERIGQIVGKSKLVWKIACGLIWQVNPCWSTQTILCKSRPQLFHGRIQLIKIQLHIRWVRRPHHLQRYLHHVGIGRVFQSLLGCDSTRTILGKPRSDTVRTAKANRLVCQDLVAANGIILPAWGQSGSLDHRTRNKDIGHGP